MGFPDSELWIADATRIQPSIDALHAAVRRGRTPVWMHGHTHDAYDVVRGGVRFVARAVGYEDDVGGVLGHNWEIRKPGPLL